MQLDESQLQPDYEWTVSAISPARAAVELAEFALSLAADPDDEEQRWDQLAFEFFRQSLALEPEQSQDHTRTHARAGLAASYANMNEFDLAE